MSRKSGTQTIRGRGRHQLQHLVREAIRQISNDTPHALRKPADESHDHRRTRRVVTERSFKKPSGDNTRTKEEEVEGG